MNELIELDKKIFLFLNGLHTPLLDPVMYFLTDTFVWVPLYAFLIYLIFKKNKISGWYFLLGAAITIVLANGITDLMKPFFARFRPSHEPSLQGLIHHVNGYLGGKYGFASGHAANTFGSAFFVWLTLKSFYPKIGWIFLWASLMTYTRIYLGVHYPGDILVGALVGLVCGWIGFKLAEQLTKRFAKQPASF
ncbi:MAG TPA: phosphatase PAP2 family protein [Cytophagales bacterium]|jgi:undecaprenyl-diphosphatase|nr:phosphatase PAP2 family protein [Cytophagales bacterium]